MGYLYLVQFQANSKANHLGTYHGDAAGGPHAGAGGAAAAGAGVGAGLGSRMTSFKNKVIAVRLSLYCEA